LPGTPSFLPDHNEDSAMKTLVSTISALALGAASLAGCSTPGVVSPPVATTEQTIYDWVCPTLLSGELDAVAALWPSDANAYAGAKALCAAGTILNPGSFIADFLIIEPIVASFFSKNGKSAEFRHYSRMAHRG
jgi:hypothetical protein